jgi:hypothetical protein
MDALSIDVRTYNSPYLAPDRGNTLAGKCAAVTASIKMRVRNVMHGHSIEEQRFGEHRLEKPSVRFIFSITHYPLSCFLHRTSTTTIMTAQLSPHRLELGVKVLLERLERLEHIQ